MNDNTKLDRTDYDSRFTMNSGEVNFIDENGEIIKDFHDYCEKRKSANTTFHDKLKVGDIVKLKSPGDEVLVVKYVDYHFNEYITSEYAGTRYGSDSENLVLFGQDDIEQIYDIMEKNKSL